MQADLVGWYSELSFVSRTLTYLLILGIVFFIIVLILNYLGVCNEERDIEGFYSTATIDDSFVPTRFEQEEDEEFMPKKPAKFTCRTVEQDLEACSSGGSSDELYDEKVCIICFEQPRNCFFVPCGHCATCYDKHVLHKLQNLPPTPFPSLPVIGHLYLFKAPFHRTLASLSGRHGPVFLLNLGSRPLLVVSSPSAAEDCLSKNDVVFANRPRLLGGEIFGYNYTNILWAPYGDLWRSLRRIAAAEVLSPHRLNVLHQIRADEIQSMARRVRLSAEAAPDGAVDMKTAFFETVNNVMMRMITGKGFYGETVESVEGKRFKKLFEKDFDGVATLGDFFPALRRLGFIKRQEMFFQKKFKLVDGFFQEMVDQHRRRLSDPGQAIGSTSTNDHKTMIEVLLTLQKKEPEFYTEEIVKGILLVMLLAGTDTSAGTLEWGLSLLLNHPSILKKAQAEIDMEVGCERLMNESDLSRLPYLHCIINETLRMYPVAPLLVPHESSNECIVGGYKVPRGTMLMVNVWAMHNDPTLWDEPRKFKPERFEGVGGDRVGFKFVPFGSGRRACPGESLATRVVGFGLGMILQCFEWERVGTELVDMEEGKGLTMPKAKPLLAKVHVRKHMNKLLS